MYRLMPWDMTGCLKNFLRMSYLGEHLISSGMSRASFSHRPVLLHEVTAVFEKMKIRCFVDGTLGSGGHAYEILKHHTHAQLIGLDMDKIMIAEAKKRLKPFQSRCRIFHRNFACLKDVMDAQHSPALDGLLLDLGISSRH